MHLTWCKNGRRLEIRIYFLILQIVFCGLPLFFLTVYNCLCCIAQYSSIAYALQHKENVIVARLQTAEFQCHVISNPRPMEVYLGVLSEMLTPLVRLGSYR